MPTAAPADRIGPIVLSLSGITKRFGAFVANRAIDLTLRRGEVLALLGENGAGKTTLMNILFGHYVADAGSVEVAGTDGTLAPLPPGSPGAALEAGIGMVHQHFALAGNLTGFENIVLGTQSLWAPVSKDGPARTKLAALVARSGLTVDLDVPVANLGVGERQRVEILKALYRDARILVLDEPTAVLTPQEAEGLFAVVRRLTADGLSVILISHKLAEVAAVSDRVAVLRAGAKVADLPTAECDREKLAALMVGREVVPAERSGGTPGGVMLELAHVSVAGADRRSTLTDVSLTIRAGEILGLAGVSGNGQTVLAALLSGLVPPSSGAVRLNGAEVTRFSPGRFVQLGVGRVPEDRHRDGVVGAMTLGENLILEDLASPDYRRFGFLRRRAIEKRAATALAAHDVRGPGPDSPARLLSGGNMQKLILARVLDRKPRLLIAAQPTRGLDIGATGDVHRRLLAARAEGAAVLLISEDLDELFRLSDRIAVIHAGQVTPAERTEDVDLKTLGLKMAGQTERTPA
ncbi:ABC transporter ATP-binding protein [Segnochrobactraceae bacterium EtOH-i3]